MKKILVLTFVQLLISGMMLSAQKTELKSGSFDFLKDQKSLLVKYDYSDMAVGKYAKEADYINDKVKELNGAEAGKGDKWKDDWFNKRTAAYEPAFEELFNKGMDKKGIVIGSKETGAAYVVTVHTTFTDVGYFIGVSSKPSFINAEITFTKISTGEKVAVVTMDKVPGVGGIKEAYAKMGKSLAAFILKKL